MGQIIAAVLANDRATACIAAKLVHVEYEDLRPVILTIDVTPAQSLRLIEDIITWLSSGGHFT